MEIATYGRAGLASTIRPEAGNSSEAMK